MIQITEMCFIHSLSKPLDHQCVDYVVGSYFFVGVLNSNKFVRFSKRDHRLSEQLDHKCIETVVVSVLNSKKFERFLKRDFSETLAHDPLNVKNKR